MDDTFKAVPGFPRYALNSEGVLIDTKTGKTKTWYIQAPIKELGGRTRNLKRGYLIARLIDEQGNKRHLFQHRAIALLHIPCPGDPDEFVVNHKDGDGGNNSISNLEWVTYSENMLHAYKTGLCKNTRPVLVRNAFTGSVLEFISVAACCREFNISHPTLMNRLNKQPGKVFDGFAFKFADDPAEWVDVKGRSVKPKAVCALDVVDGKFIVAENQNELARLTGLTDAAINAALTKNSLLPIKHYVVMWNDTREMVAPSFSPEQIRLFRLPRTRADQGGWLEKNLITGVTEIYLLNDIAKRHGYSISQMQNVMKSGKVFKEQFVFEYVSPVPIDYSPLAA